MQNNAIDRRKVQDGLDFILNHFQEPQFPRRIMTKKLGYQVEVFNKQEALKHFNNSNYEDCRINAYPSFTEYQAINRTPIRNSIDRNFFIVIYVDPITTQSNINTNQTFRLAIDRYNSNLVPV